MAKEEMNPQQAMFVLRTFNGLINTSLLLKKDKDGEEMSSEMKSIMSRFNDAVDLACEALALMSDNYVDIEEGGHNDGRGKTGSGDN